MNITKELINLINFATPYKESLLINDVDHLIELLGKRGYGDRARLTRKMLEELGEYCEAVEFDIGATRKVAKFKDKDPKKMLKEEIADVIMIGFALAKVEGHKITDMLQTIKEKLSAREQEFLNSKK